MSRAETRRFQRFTGKHYLPAAHISKRKAGYTAELTEGRIYRNKRMEQKYKELTAALKKVAQTSQAAGKAFSEVARRANEVKEATV